MGRKINDNNIFTNDFLKAVIQDVGENEAEVDLLRAYFGVNKNGNGHALKKIE